MHMPTSIHAVVCMKIDRSYSCLTGLLYRDASHFPTSLVGFLDDSLTDSGCSGNHHGLARTHRGQGVWQGQGPSGEAHMGRIHRGSGQGVMGIGGVVGGRGIRGRGVGGRAGGQVGGSW